jgi:hypothetical protein
MPSPAPSKFILIARGTDAPAAPDPYAPNLFSRSPYLFGIMYTDGKVLSVAPTPAYPSYEGVYPMQLRTSAQINAALRPRLTSIPITFSVYPAPAQASSNLNVAAPCTMLMSGVETRPAILINSDVKGRLCYRFTPSGGDTWGSSTLADWLRMGGTIYSRRGPNGRPWG